MARCQRSPLIELKRQRVGNTDRNRDVSMSMCVSGRYGSEGMKSTEDDGVEYRKTKRDRDS